MEEPMDMFYDGNPDFTGEILKSDDISLNQNAFYSEDLLENYLNGEAGFSSDYPTK